METHQRPFHEVPLSCSRRASWLSSGGPPDHSCGTAPDFHRLRLSAPASGPMGTC